MKHQPCAEILSGLEAAYLPDFFDLARADALFVHCRGLTWRNEHIRMFGHMRAVPRLTTWYGDSGVVYRYSGETHVAETWTDVLAALRDRLQEALAARFNFVLGNFYRNGRDSMGWHADDETELGRDPLIVSLSFGATRRLRFRRRAGTTQSSDGNRTGYVDLTHGSMLMMWGRSQREWQHALPRTARDVGERINLTLRRVFPT